MKSLLKKVLVLVVILAVALSIFSSIAYAEPVDSGVQDGQNGTGTTENESSDEEIVLPEAEAFDDSVSTDVDYGAYKNSIADTTRPDGKENEVLLKAEDAKQFDPNTGKIVGSLPLIKKAPLNNPADEREGALFYDEGICGWVVNVKTSGWYNITFSYLLYEKVTYTNAAGEQITLDSKSSAAQRRVYIDYKVPFYEARQVNFERVWKDAGILKVDSQTFNEKRPYQAETEQWQTVSVRDYMGYEANPFLFYFEAGTHTLAFEAVKEGMIVEYAVLHQIDDAPTYAELKAQYEANGYKHVTGTDKVLFVQAEGLHNPGTSNAKLNTYTKKQYSTFLSGLSSVYVDQYNSFIDPSLDATGAYDATKDPTYNILKSSPTLYAIQDRSSPSTVPYHHSKIRYNTIGADKWQSPNDWIQWTINVPEDGLYAISFKARQNTLSGMSTTRKLTVNGVVPCQEVINLTFRYSNSFMMYTPATAEGETIYFYLNKGNNTIRLETTLGQLGDLLAKAENSLTNLNIAYRKILMITGPSPDVNNDYMLNTMVPDAIKMLQDEEANLKALEAEFIRIYDTAENRGISAQLTSLKSMILLLERMNKDHTQIPSLFANLKDSIASMGTWINDMSQNPLELDYFVVSSKDYLEANVMPDPDAGFFAKALHEIRSFIASFTEDYDNIGGTVAQDGQQPVVVWLETGAGLTGSRDNATILKQLIDDIFTQNTGIIVSTRLVAGGSLLPSVLSGIGPEVCLARGAVDAVNYAFRGAVMNLADEKLFPNYKEILAPEETDMAVEDYRFAPSAVAPFRFGNGIYAVPETQDFYMTFYRTDILDELGLEPPETWTDVDNIIKELQNKQMTFAMPVPVVGAVGSGNLSFAMLLYQKGGQYYTDDRDSTLLTSDEALDAFKEWTEFYTSAGLPNTYDFANRFRTGEVPIGISSYSQYSQLAVFAPEIQGLWEFSLVPGTPRVDENGETYIDHSCASNTSGCVMLSIDSSTEEGMSRIKNAWEFMTWWTSEEAQYRFGTEIESLLGAAARYQTANRQAMAKLPWDKASMVMIQKQWNWAKEIPQVPGGYYTARNIEFAWKEVINNPAADPNTTFVEYVSKIDREIDRKREEFKDKIAQMTGKAVE
jgi:ABC-type glycerol-3-phosphate transport system substrate-binding protein